MADRSMPREFSNALCREPISQVSLVVPSKITPLRLFSLSLHLGAMYYFYLVQSLSGHRIVMVEISGQHR